MPGSYLLPFRQGNRSEYLALYILSALGFSIKVPREEDVGFDFHCSIATKKENLIITGASYLVQVKSASEINKIKYDSPNAIKWLFNQELPLFLGVADKTLQTLNLYTTSNMWYARNRAGNPSFIHLAPNSFSNSTWEKGVSLPEPLDKKKKKWKVPLGPPICSIKIDDLENNKLVKRYQTIMNKAIMLEQTNITYRRLHTHISQYPTFISKTKFKTQHTIIANSRKGANVNEQLKAIAPILINLAFNYKEQRNISNLKKIQPMIKILPESPEKILLRKRMPELFKKEKYPRKNRVV